MPIADSPISLHRGSVGQPKGWVATGRPGEREYISRIGWAIRAVSGRTPWESKCLVQAITGKVMLRRKRIHNTLYLGVAKDGDNKMQAHAWLRVGGQVLTGGGFVDNSYTVVAMFADD